MIGDSHYLAAMHDLISNRCAIIPARAGTQLVTGAGGEVDPCLGGADPVLVLPAGAAK